MHMAVSLQGAGPAPSAPVPDPFELLRRSKDLVLNIRKSIHGIHGAFCHFDAATGWPRHTLKDRTGPLPDGICKIDETAERGISLRQLLVTYEHVKLRCVAEGWTGSHKQPDDTYAYDGKGTKLRPETVTLYDLCEYVIKPSTKTHKCSFVELVTGVGNESVRLCPDGHAPMARRDINYEEAEETSCTKCANKLEWDDTYWVCHRCVDKHKLCDACAPAPVSMPRAELQRPLWFVSHWYGCRRCMPERRCHERMRFV
jgi:hypothetical protein